MKLENMSEEELRTLQQEMNVEVNHFRSEGKFVEAREIREEVLRIQAMADIKQQERYAEYDRIAAESNLAESAAIQAEAADAISEAESIFGGKG
jgi:hypothetical protein